MPWIIFVFILVFRGIYCQDSVEVANPRWGGTITENDLIRHELGNPFTPYYRDEKYSGKRSKSCFLFFFVPFPRAVETLLIPAISSTQATSK